MRKLLGQQAVKPAVPQRPSMQVLHLCWQAGRQPKALVLAQHHKPEKHSIVVVLLL